MKKFNENEKCPKCGYANIDVVYKDKNYLYQDGFLKVTCKRCDFQWNRAPLEQEVKE